MNGKRIFSILMVAMLACSFLAPAAVGVSIADNHGGGADTGTSADSDAGTDDTNSDDSSNDTGGSGDSGDSSTNETDSTPTRPAEVDIRQPHYVDSEVETTTAENTPVYEVRGPVQWITPENFDSDDVVGVEVEENGAQIRYSESTGEWRLDTGGKDGTYTVVWTVSESVGPEQSTDNETAANETTTGDTRLVTHRANVQVTAADMVHVSASEYKKTSGAADKWNEHVVQPLQSVVDDEERIPTLLQERGIPWIKFTENPTSALEGTFLTLLVTMFFTPGGWFFATLFVGLPLTAIIVLAIKLKQAKAKLGDVDEVEQARAKIDQELAKRLLNQEDVTDGPGLPERFAVPIREALGRDVWSAAEGIVTGLSPAAVKQLHIGAAIETGEYVVDVLRGDDGDVEDATVVREDDASEVEDDYERVSLSDATPEVYGHLGLDDVPGRPLREGVSVSTLPRVPGAEHETVDEMLEHHAQRNGVDIENGFNGDVGTYADALGDVLDYVASTDYVEDDGSANATQVALNVLHAIISVPSEQYQQGYFHRYRDAFLYAADEINPEDKLHRQMEQTKQQGIETNAHTDDVSDYDWDYEPGDGGDRR